MLYETIVDIVIYLYKFLNNYKNDWKQLIKAAFNIIQKKKSILFMFTFFYLLFLTVFPHSKTTVLLEVT